MATLARFGKIRVCMFPDDHNPPHFHVHGPGWRASFRINDLKLLKGSYPRNACDEALEWARKSIPYLYDKWVELNERDDQSGNGF